MKRYIQVTGLEDETEGNSEFHGVWGITVSESESGSEILPGHSVLLETGQDWGIDGLLEGLSGVGDGFGWGLLGEESLGSGSSSSGLSLEGFVSDVLNISDGDLGAGAHGVDLVDSSNWDTVDLEWTGDGEES